MVVADDQQGHAHALDTSRLDTSRPKATPLADILVDAIGDVNTLVQVPMYAICHIGPHFLEHYTDRLFITLGQKRQFHYKDLPTSI